MTEPTIGHDKELPKAWMDITALRYPYNFDGNGCTIGDNGDTNESRLHNKNIRSVLVHLRFDQHAQLHCPTCFKKSEECRTKLPMLICNETYLFDNKHILVNSDDNHFDENSVYFGLLLACQKKTSYIAFLTQPHPP